MQAATWLNSARLFVSVFGTRYTDYMIRANSGNFMAVLASFRFDDLEHIAERAVQKLALQQEARGRFGTDDKLFANTPAEQFCEDVLAGIGMDKLGLFLDEKQVDSILMKHPAVLPHTLADCLHELNYWSQLYWLLSAWVVAMARPKSMPERTSCSAGSRLSGHRRRRKRSPYSGISPSKSGWIGVKPRRSC